MYVRYAPETLVLFAFFQERIIEYLKMWFGKRKEDVEYREIDGINFRVHRYNSKEYQAVLDYLNEGRAPNTFDLPESCKTEWMRKKAKSFEIEKGCKQVTIEE